MDEDQHKALILVRCAVVPPLPRADAAGAAQWQLNSSIKYAKRVGQAFMVADAMPLDHPASEVVARTKCAAAAARHGHPQPPT